MSIDTQDASPDANKPRAHVDAMENSNGGLDLPAGEAKSDEAAEEREEARFNESNNHDQ